MMPSQLDPAHLVIVIGPLGGSAQDPGSSDSWLGFFVRMSHSNSNPYTWTVAVLVSDSSLCRRRTTASFGDGLITNGRCKSRYIFSVLPAEIVHGVWAVSAGSI